MTTPPLPGCCSSFPPRLNLPALICEQVEGRLLRARLMSAAHARVSPPLPGRRHGCRRWSLEYECIDSESSVRATGDPNGCCDDGLFSGYPPACLPARSHPLCPSPPPSTQCCLFVRTNTTRCRLRAHQGATESVASVGSNPQILNRPFVCFYCVSSQLQKASKKRCSMSSRS